MRKTLLLAALVAVPATVWAQSTPGVPWTVTSKVVDLTVPGAPGFMLKMAKGKSQSSKKCLTAGQTIAVLLAPNPKMQCRMLGQQIADGRYTQTLSCPQKRGQPMKVTRTGTYDANGFTGRAEMTGEAPKGAMRILLDQRATRAAGTCRA